MVASRRSGVLLFLLFGLRSPARPTGKGFEDSRIGTHALRYVYVSVYASSSLVSRYSPRSHVILKRKRARRDGKDRFRGVATSRFLKPAVQCGTAPALGCSPIDSSWIGSDQPGLDYVTLRRPKSIIAIQKCVPCSLLENSYERDPRAAARQDKDVGDDMA